VVVWASTAIGLHANSAATLSVRVRLLMDIGSNSSVVAFSWWPSLLSAGPS